MKIIYARLFNLGNYENERIEVEDEVLAGETTQETYRRLRAEVYAMAGRADPAVIESERPSSSSPLDGF